MYKLTITGKDNTKQITMMNKSIGLDPKGKPLKDSTISSKVDEIARTIAGGNYKYHKYEYL